MTESSFSNQASSVDEVIGQLRKLCMPLGTEYVPINNALGRVLREIIRAPEDQPAFDRSSVDGYAVRVDDPAQQFCIVDEIHAGDWKPRKLQLGESVRISTGGAMPCDGLQVVMKEVFQIQKNSLFVQQRNRERNIRFQGEDAQIGQILLNIGTVLNPGSLALLASVGRTEVLVTRLPRFLHVATGNEIVAPDKMPNRGQIRDSNSTLVQTFLMKHGMASSQLRIEESAVAIRSVITNHQTSSQELDVLLISGGASVGDHDFTRKALEQSGFAIFVSKTTTRPGKPLIVAKRGNTIAFGLPGNPLAHFVCLNLYVQLALKILTGYETRPVFNIGKLEATFADNNPGRETFWPAYWKLQDGVVWLLPLRWNSSGDLTSLATANALIRVRASKEKLEYGSQVEFVSTEIIS